MKFWPAFLSLLLFMTAAAPSRAAPDGARYVIGTGNSLTNLTLFRFRAEDRPAYRQPDLDDSAWDTLPVHFSWTRYPRYQEYGGTGWYRATLVFTEEPRHGYAFSVPLQRRGTRFYVNGTLVGETQLFNDEGESPASYGRPDLVAVPRGLLKKGPNSLALRTAANDHMASLNGRLWFGPRRLALEKLFRDQMRAHTMVAIYCFLFLYFTVYFLFRTRQQHHLWMALSCLAIALWTACYQGSIIWFVDNYTVFRIMLFAGALSVTVFFLNFIRSLLSLESKLVTRIFTALFGALFAALCVEIAVTGGLAFFNRYLFPIELYGILAGIIAGVGLAARGVRLRRPFAGHVLFSMAVLLVSYAYSFLYFAGIVMTDPLVIEGFFFVILMFSYILAARYSRLLTDLEKAHGDLLVIDTMKDQFLATTSHELRTPLHGIKGIAESLRDGDCGPVTTEQRHNLSLIADNAARLSSLVGDILDFSKLTAGRADLYLESVDLPGVIDAVVSLMRSVSDRDAVTIETDIAPLPPLLLDRNRIEQVLINLLNNALVHADHGAVTVEARLQSGRALVTVRDQGPGIAPEDRERIFAPFTRGRDTAARNPDGLGLGLAIARELVELHGGTITVESEPGRGSAFTVDLPVRRPPTGIILPPPAAAPPAAVPVTGLDTGGATYPSSRRPAASPGDGREPSEERVILAVDDDTTNLQIITNCCAPLGYRVVTATSGGEALALAAGRLPDLVLMDLMMPGMSGFEACERIHELAGAEYVPVIILTARDRVHDLVEGFRHGANDYLTKPFDRQELLARIENHLAIRDLYRGERALNRTLNIYRNMVSSSRDHLACLDGSERFIAANEAFARAYGSTAGAVLGRHFGDVHGPWISGPETIEKVRRALGGDSVTFEGWHLLPGGGLRYLYTTLTPYVDSEGVQAGAVLTAVDLTERVEIEKQIIDVSNLERMKIGMELHDGLGHFLLHIAVRANILAASLGQLADRAGEGPAAAAHEIEKLINDAIARTRRISHGVLPMGIEGKTVTELFNRIRSEFEEFGTVEKVYDIDESLPLADPVAATQLYYITAEAVKNAILHARATRIAVSLRRSGSDALLAVEDNGTGIEGGRGGLGLNIMEYRARMVGATLSVESAPHAGSRVSCRFPLSQ